MAQRLGFRLRNSDGTHRLGVGLAVGISGVGFRLTDSDSNIINLLEPDLIDGGGGTLEFYASWPSTKYGITKLVGDVADGLWWTLWFTPPEGEFTEVSLSIDIVNPSGSNPSSLHYQIVKDDNGAETILDASTATFVEGGFGTVVAQKSVSVEFSFGPPAGYQNFWAGFEKTRENQPT
jgi:hypothetical protein